MARPWRMGASWRSIFLRWSVQTDHVARYHHGDLCNIVYYDKLNVIVHVSRLAPGAKHASMLTHILTRPNQLIICE